MLIGLILVLLIINVRLFILFSMVATKWGMVLMEIARLIKLRCLTKMLTYLNWQTLINCLMMLVSQSLTQESMAE